MTFKSFYTSGLTGASVTRKKEQRVNGVEQLTVYYVCFQCRVLSLTDCEPLSDDTL